MSVSFGSWKVLETKQVVICIGLWGLEDLCLDGLFCVWWVLLGDACYLGMSDSHLLLSRSGSEWCDMDADMSQTQCD